VTKEKIKAKEKKKQISLALQGGGAHGAFTWGVLDRLLELDCFNFNAISATSAGAMNAAVMMSGYLEGGNEGARANLEKFWRLIGDVNPLSRLPVMGWEKSNPYIWNMHLLPSYLMVDAFTRLYSPYEFNPLNYNPLRTILEQCIKTEYLNSCTTVRMFISATRVSDGQPRIFECEEISIDVLIASTSLPYLYQAVEIEGEHYWDGGYVGNPLLDPLMNECRDGDVLIVQINPVRREKHPTGAWDIVDRLNEITFNSSLLAELWQINFVNNMVENMGYKGEHYRPVRMHIIEPHAEMLLLDATSKLNAHYHFFEYLRDLGRESADKWIAANYDNVGKESTLDIPKLFRLREPGAKAKLKEEIKQKVTKKA